jgi:hypothetical protein
VGTYSGYLSSPEYGGAGVPPIYKWMLNFSASDPAKHRRCGDPPKTSDGCGAVKGLFAWTATGVGGADAALNINLPVWDAAARENARAFVEASNAAHELGHLLGLKHHGAEATPTGDKNYKSIMSYAYSHFGLPQGGLFPEHYIDYSRNSSPNLDWRLGKGLGALTFIAGQDGEIPDFYANASDDDLVDIGEPPSELSVDEAIQTASPESVRGFISAFDVPAAPSFPTLEGATVSVQAGESVDVDLHGEDPAGAAVSYVVDTKPRLGRAEPTAAGLRYTADSGAEGDESVTVRAVNASLGSEPVAVVVRVTPAPAGGGPSAPGGTPVGGVASSNASSKGRLRLTRVTVKAKRRLVTLRLRLSDRARLTLAAERRVGKRFRRVGAKRRTVGSGTRTLTIKVPRGGTYRLVLVARTADGRTAVARRTVRVR